MRARSFSSRRCGDVFLHEEARACAADLPLVEPYRVHNAFYHAVEVGVVEHYEGRLAAKLQRNALAAACGDLADVAANIG